MLLRFLAAAMLVLSLGGCVQRDHLVANPSGDGAPARAARYTHTVSVSDITSVEVIPLRIDPAFWPDERQEILRATAEWNHVLNGYVRFEAVVAIFLTDPLHGNTAVSRGDAGPPRSKAWAILPARGAAPLGLRVVRPMALTQSMPQGGGVMMIHRDLANVATLAGVVRHELGHVLGLLHDPDSRLMSPVHDPAGQQCIDKAAVAAIAGMRGLPLARLNWCEEIDEKS